MKTDHNDSRRWRPLSPWGRRGRDPALVLALLLLVAVPCQVHAQRRTFTETWERVRQSHEGLEAERAALERARDLEKASRALARPSLKLAATYTHLSDPVSLNLLDLNPMPAITESELGQKLAELLAQLGISPGDVNRAFTTDFTRQDILYSNLLAMWPLYAGGRIDAARRIRGAQTTEASELVELKLRSVFSRTARLYFGVVLAREVVETRRMAEAALDRHLGNAVKLEEQGQIARVERLSAQANRDRAAVATKKAEEDLEIARLALASLLGEEDTFEPSSPLFVNATLPPAEEFVQKALDSHPGLEILAARKQQADGLIHVERGARLPEVFAFGNLTVYEDDSLLSKMAPDWAVGLGVGFEILDRSGHAAKTEAAREAVLQIGHLEAQTRRDLRVLVEKTWKEAVQARDEYEGLASSLELARENERLREKAFAQGLSTSLEVVDAQLLVTGVRTQRMAAAYNYVNALARLLSLSGQMDAMAEYEKSGSEVIP
ncbi:MAG TPA: TolC family protein [Acidobacteria bacterium]|nr:TolC family protein [Acidobacteriota bacterium]